MMLRAVAGLLAITTMASACGGGGGAGSSPAPSPTVTSPPIAASGRIAFITPEGNLGLVSPNGSDLRTLTDSGGVQAFRWSPDGSMLAIEIASGPESAVRVIRPDGQQVFELAAAGNPLWAPSGTLLAVTQRSGVTIVDSGGQEVRRVEGAVRPEWSPDSGSLAFVRAGADGLGVPMIAEVQSGVEKPLWPDIGPDKPDYPIAWHPGGNVIAYRNAVYEPATGIKTDLPGMAVGWNPDGRMLMVTLQFKPADNATAVQLLDFTQGGKPVIGMDVRPTADEKPAWQIIRQLSDWSPDGRLLVYMDPQPASPRVRTFDTVEITQKIRKNISGERPDMSPDGTHLAFMYKGQVWVLAMDASAFRAIVPGGFPAWQPTGP